MVITQTTGHYKAFTPFFNSFNCSSTVYFILILQTPFTTEILRRNSCEQVNIVCHVTLLILILSDLFIYVWNENYIYLL